MSISTTPDYASIPLTDEEINEALLEWRKRKFFHQKAILLEGQWLEHPHDNNDSITAMKNKITV